MATIATHNGTQIARQHNLRNPKVVSKEPHIDINGISEIWLDEEPRKAYERLFGEAVRKYNAKQKRSDRKISDYYKKIREDKKKHFAYEMIVGVYDEDISIETKKEILKEFADGWNERNPNLELIGLYFHADEEGDAHLHIDYIPVARGCKRGLETQTALVKALEQQGIEAGQTMKETCQILWEAKENQYLESLCNARGISIEHPMRDGEKSVHHLETEVYKLEKQKEQLQTENEKLKMELAIMSQKADNIEKQIEEGRDVLQNVDERKNLTLLDRFRLFVKGKSLQQIVTSFINTLIDEFEESEKQKGKSIKDWKPQKSKGRDIGIER